ncbi:MAG: lamin tail domain-containing protein [Candidatus Saccharimonadales bacterium]
MLKRASLILAVLTLLLTPIVPQKAAAEDLPPPNAALLISEVQTRSAEYPNDRFVELYNPNSYAVSFAGWKLEYKPYKDGSWSNRINSSQPADAVYEIGSGQFYLAATNDFAAHNPDVAVHLRLNNSALASADGGHIRVVNPTDEVADLLGWGKADSPKIKAALAPDAGQSLQRCFLDGILADGGNNFADFAVYNQTSPGNALECSEPEPEPEPDPETPPGNEPGGTTCEGIIISELLPNPAGADGGKEFIELYNPTDEIIPLKGCSLQTTANKKIFNFDANSELQPEEYRAFHDSTTSLTLTNAGGGTVWLLSPTEELQAISYPPNVADDVAWALFQDGWFATFQPTPNAANVFAGTKPCPSGQVRNPDTNRCASENSSEPSLTPCKEGQERNAETNRCHAVLSAANTPTVCKPGQERNPETNRCRKVAADDSTLKPCAEGQERSPETNRCRKIVASGNIAGVKDVASSSIANNPRWWLAGAAALGAVGFGAYEWRRDIANAATGLKNKLLRRPPAK